MSGTTRRGSNSPNNAHYTVYHSGGSTDVYVNQQVYGSEWVSLGTFVFAPGTDRPGDPRRSGPSGQDDRGRRRSFPDYRSAGAEFRAAWVDVFHEGLQNKEQVDDVFRRLLAGGATVSDIANWDGASWSELSSGMTDKVNALTVYNGQLIAGGDFTTAGGVAAKYIAAWDGTEWSALGDKPMNARVHALTVFNNELIAGGLFTVVDEAAGENKVTVNYIAKWNGTSWSALGSGMNGRVYALTVCQQ